MSPAHSDTVPEIFQRLVDSYRSNLTHSEILCRIDAVNATTTDSKALWRECKEIIDAVNARWTGTDTLVGEHQQMATAVNTLFLKHDETIEVLEKKNEHLQAVANKLSVGPRSSMRIRDAVSLYCQTRKSHFRARIELKKSEAKRKRAHLENRGARQNLGLKVELFVRAYIKSHSAPGTREQCLELADMTRRRQIDLQLLDQYSNEAGVVGARGECLKKLRDLPEAIRRERDTHEAYIESMLASLDFAMDYVGLLKRLETQLREAIYGSIRTEVCSQLVLTQQFREQHATQEQVGKWMRFYMFQFFAILFTCDLFVHRMAAPN
jgi:hypothetical protein